MDEPQIATHRAITERLQRLGDTMTELELPGATGVAILHSYSQEAMDISDDEHFWTAHAAWYDLLRAHVPTAIVSEDLIAQGGLLGRFAAILLPRITVPLPSSVLAGLQTFERAASRYGVTYPHH